MSPSATFEHLRAALTAQPLLEDWWFLLSAEQAASAAARPDDADDQDRLNALLLGEPAVRAPGSIRWRPLDAAQAAELWQVMLTRSQAYGEPLLQPARAATYWQQFCALVGPLGRYFANISPDSLPRFLRGEGYSWSPVTDNTFSTALFALAPGQALGFIITDED